MRWGVFTLLFLVFSGQLIGQQDNDEITSNAQFYKSERPVRSVPQAVIVFPVDFFFGKYGAHYEIQVLEWLHFEVEGGALGSNYQGDMLLKPIEPISENQSLKAKGYYYSGCVILNSERGYLGHYWGVGLMYGYRNYSLENKETIQSSIFSLYFKFQYPFSKHFFIQGNFCLGIESVDQIVSTGLSSSYSARFYRPVDVGVGFRF